MTKVKIVSNPYCKEAKQREYEKEMLLPLFDKGENCRRPRYIVNVK